MAANPTPKELESPREWFWKAAEEILMKCPSFLLALLTLLRLGSDCCSAGSGGVKQKMKDQTQSDVGSIIVQPVCTPEHGRKDTKLQFLSAGLALASPCCAVRGWGALLLL